MNTTKMIGSKRPNSVSEVGNSLGEDTVAWAEN